MTPQAGILALGTAEHCYLELDLRPGHTAAELVSAVTALTGPLSTTGGVNVVVGFRPSLWAEVASGAAPAGVHGFDDDIVGPDGFRMPATQHDAWIWVAGGDRTAVFDNTREALRAVRPVARLCDEVTGWLYRHDRDLTGFIDGTENPNVLAAPVVAVASDGTSVALVQRWRHDSDAWEELGVPAQELAMGRTRDDSTELDDEHKPPTSHVARTVVEENGAELKIFRRNTAYGTVSDHGTMFVGFCASQHPFERMLERMAGVGDGVRDALTRYTTPLSGAYYMVPSVPALAAFAPPDEED